MEKDTLFNIIDSTAGVAGGSSASLLNIWLIVAIVEFVIIVILLATHITRKSNDDDKKNELKKKVLEEGNIDFGNIINSTFNAEALYKELIVICHPDRFTPDDEKVAMANELSMQITQNRHNYKRLVELRDEAKQKLNINI